MIRIRGFLAVVIGLLIFASFSFATLVGPTIFFWASLAIFLQMSTRCGILLRKIVFQGILAMKMNLKNFVPPEGKKRPTIVIANHPSLLLMMLFVSYIFLITGKHPVFVGKKEHESNPFLGPPMKRTGMMIFIDRTREAREQTLKLLRENAQKVFAAGGCIVIFPDRSRPTAEKIAADHEQFAHVYRVTDFDGTLVPKDGGFEVIYGVAPENARVIDVTAFCNKSDSSLVNAARVFGATYFFIAHDVTDDVPCDFSERRAWMMNMWRGKNRIMREEKKRKKLSATL